MCDASVVGYTGAFLDAVAGAYPLGDGYRMYLPWLMRFSAPDDASPFGAGGVNCYAYCEGDPINSVDPTGHEGESFVEILINLHHQGKHSELPDLNAAGDLHTILNSFSAAEKHWLENIVSPLKIDKFPTSDDELTKLYRDAFDAGQIVLNPEDVSHGKVLWQWNPDIELNGKRLGQDSWPIVDLMKRYGLSRGHSYMRSDAPYRATLPYEVHIDTGLDIALGGLEPGTNGYRHPFFLKNTKAAEQRPDLHYAARFAKVARYKGFATELTKGRVRILGAQYRPRT
jgi:RHS repeat-associated protein